MDNRESFAMPNVDMTVLGIVILVAVIILFIAFLYAFWRRTKGEALSPYSGLPLRPAIGLSIVNMERVLRFLYDLHDLDNPLIDFTKAVFCRETGRIFPNAIDMFGNVKVGWGFIRQRAPGNFVSWGSLTDEQKMAVMDFHNSMEGFQIDESSPEPDPSKITKEYAFTIPGPLYVDMKNKVLMGWMEVPRTSLEVLIIQKPTRTGKYML